MIRIISGLIRGSGIGASSIANAFTTSDGKQPFLIVGDSIANGTSLSGKGPTPVAGTVYEFDGTNIVEVGSNDLLQANTGSQYPRMGIDYFTATGRKCVFVETANGGAEFSPNVDTNNWSASGDLYPLMLTKATNGLTTLGLTKYRGILLILGINDARGSTTLATIQTDMQSLFNRLTADFPDTPIYCCNVGRSETAISDSRIDAVRGYLSTIISSNPLYKMAFDLRTYAQDFPAYYNSDNLHLNQTGCNALGTELANYISAN